MSRIVHIPTKWCFPVFNNVEVLDHTPQNAFRWTLYCGHSHILSERVSKICLSTIKVYWKCLKSQAPVYSSTIWRAFSKRPVGLWSVSILSGIAFPGFMLQSSYGTNVVTFCSLKIRYWRKTGLYFWFFSQEINSLCVCLLGRSDCGTDEKPKGISKIGFLFQRSDSLMQKRQYIKDTSYVTLSKQKRKRGCNMLIWCSIQHQVVFPNIVLFCLLGLNGRIESRLNSFPG